MSDIRYVRWSNLLNEICFVNEVKFTLKVSYYLLRSIVNRPNCTELL